MAKGKVRWSSFNSRSIPYVRENSRFHRNTLIFDMEMGIARLEMPPQ
jgi:hypothetical protein